jgi:hypothetical protein
MYLAIVLSLLSSVMPLAALQEGLGSSPAEIYQQIPREQRESLRQAVEKVIVAQKARDWKTVWDLYDKRQGESSQPYDKRQDETESNFLKKMNRSRLLRDFKPAKVSFFPPDSYWVIEGCASFAGDAKGEGIEADVHARWADARWYLSSVLISLYSDLGERGMKVHKCSFSK